uniref:NF-kappa-B inhibitor delta-like n=1 Tax=Geotrypetes seraphini TaxID=260995 RepID=A0A6P8P0S0_GEOSA|nr:NF-kappa-B inhibitor delta-like [Geotrypetes seraphini]
MTNIFCCLRILHICAAKGMREFSLAAAERMADLRRLDVKEHKGKTPLLVAVTARQPAIVRDLILAGADVHAVDNKGQSALHLAATYGYPEVIQVIAAFALPVNIEMKDFEGHTPLHCAVLAHNSVLREQREGPGLTPTQQDELEPRSRELKACIHLLVQMGALVSSQDLKSSKTVLHYAVQDANLPLLKFFLELEMHKPSKLVNNQAHGNTALHMAAALYHEPQQEEIIRLLLKHGADPSARNLENDQAIHLVQAGETGDRVNLTLADKL